MITKQEIIDSLKSYIDVKKADGAKISYPKNKKLKTGHG